VAVRPASGPARNCASHAVRVTMRLYYLPAASSVARSSLSPRCRPTGRSTDTEIVAFRIVHDDEVDGRAGRPVGSGAARPRPGRPAQRPCLDDLDPFLNTVVLVVIVHLSEIVVVAG
jgi:hypothetical protein